MCSHSPTRTHSGEQLDQTTVALAPAAELDGLRAGLVSASDGQPERLTPCGPSMSFHPHGLQLGFALLKGAICSGARRDHTPPPRDGVRGNA